jgi:hypothetical protein
MLYYLKGLSVTCDICITRMHTTNQIQQNKNNKGSAKQVNLKNFSAIHVGKNIPRCVLQP